MTDQALSPLEIDVPAPRTEAGLRAIVRVSCGGWARLRITAPGEPVRSRWLGPGRHALSFTVAFGQQVTIERASLLSRYRKTIQLPQPHWSLRPAGLEAQADLRELSTDVRIPSAVFKQAALAPAFEPGRIAFNPQPDALAMRLPQGFSHRIDPILDGNLQPRLSMAVADVPTEAITLQLNAQAIEPVIPDLNLGHPNPGVPAESPRTQDQPGAPR